MLSKWRDLNWPAWVSAALFVSVALAASCFSSQSTHRHLSEARHEDSRTSASNGATRHALPIKPPKSNETENGNSGACDGSCLPATVWKFIKGLFLWWINDPNAFFGSWVAGFTGALYWRTVLQERANKISERAYVKIIHQRPGVEWFGSDPGKFLVRIIVRNSGKTPATITNVSLSTFVFVGQEPAPGQEMYETPDRPPYARAERSVGAFLVADDQSTHTVVLRISAEEHTEVMAGRSQMLVFGFVDYVDRFGESHRGGYGRAYKAYRDDAAQYGKDFDFKSRSNLVFIDKSGYNYDAVSREADS